MNKAKSDLEISFASWRARNRAAAAGVALVLALVVGACESSEPPYVEKPVEDLYNEALDALEDGRYTAAQDGFEEVERQHPYSKWATKAQLMAAFSYYLSDRYDDAVNAADRFISLHPGDPDVAYAYYMIGISYYEQIVDVGRDQDFTELALASLEEVVRRFPDTEYARDARLKADLARDHLAGKEMSIGMYYLERGQYAAAINRFRTVIERHQTTSQVPEALHRLTEAYLSLGIVDEAQTAAAVLGYNYPGSEWYLDSYALITGADLRPAEDEESWLSSTFNTIF